jgi:sortase A
VGAVFVGLGVLAVAWGVVTWQWGDPLTGAYTRWQQRGLSAEYERLAVAYRLPPTPPTGRPEPDRRSTARRMREQLRPGQPIGRIHVDRLGLDMVVVYGTDSDTLRKGPGHDPRTFFPGEGELVYIAGHRTTFGAPFAHIDRLRRGDRVVLEMPYGRFVYGVRSWVIVPADDVGRLRSRAREEIALQACHPRFSARERYIVYALPLGREQ